MSGNLSNIDWYSACLLGATNIGLMEAMVDVIFLTDRLVVESVSRWLQMFTRRLKWRKKSAPMKPMTEWEMEMFQIGLECL